MKSYIGAATKSTAFSAASRSSGAGPPATKKRLSLFWPSNVKMRRYINLYNHLHALVRFEVDEHARHQADVGKYATGAILAAHEFEAPAMWLVEHRVVEQDVALRSTPPAGAPSARAGRRVKRWVSRK